MSRLAALRSLAEKEQREAPVGPRGSSWIRAASPAVVLSLLTLHDLLAKRVDGMDHDDEDCPMDDTCECANVAEVNKAFAAFDAALELSRP